MLERIGSGSMGVVWRARDERLERIVAIKQLLPQPGLTDEERADARRRALREARIAARLHHPNAIVIFDVAEEDGDPCLVMEYMAASSLAASLAENGSMPAAAVAALGEQIATALATAHASGIVHRDVKPGNILINAAGVAKITDFGIARASGDSTVTQTGMFAGTPAYLAPEVARGQEPTAASDVFSFGATLYDAVEGGPPFPERQNQLALLRLVAEGKVQPPRQAGVLTALLMQLLRPEPDERPTMAEASRMLADLAADRPAKPAGKGRTSPTLPDIRPPDAPAPDAAPPDPQPPGDTADTPPVQDAVPPGFAPDPAPALVFDDPLATPPPRSPAARRMLLVGALVVVVALVAVGIILLTVDSGGRGGGHGPAQAGGGERTSVAPPPVSRPVVTPTTPSVIPIGKAVSSGSIEYTPAGLLIVRFYTNLDDPAAMWQLLTPGAQGAYGNLAAFTQYWAQFSQVSAAHAINVTKNDDGSLNVPIDVTYTNATGSHPSHKVLRVVQQNGQLLIDADTR